MLDLNMSESEEMYLITIARLGERGVEGPVPLAQLAEELEVLPVSANQMIHKLEEEGAVEYLPYKGVSLRPEGRQLANRTLRRRRLWEVFLVERLGLPFEEADQLACRVEHISPDTVTERLAAFLGHPQRSSQGWPIPPAETASVQRRLNALQAGRSGRITGVKEPSLEEFLREHGLEAGQGFEVLASSEEGGVLVEFGGRRINLTGEAAAEVQVEEVYLQEPAE